MTVTSDAAEPPRLRAWWTVAVCSLVSITSVLDRGILNLIVDPVRHDLAISDVQISMLQGLAFGLFYATVGLPLGLCVDQLSRRRLVIAGVALWSLATIYGGLSTSFTGMFLSRVLVGLGEAILSPAAISMISDMFPAKQRGRPISVFLMGQALASGIAIQVTGLILAAVPKGQLAFLFGNDPPAPWRAAFIICGALGLPAILLLLSIREPKRRGLAIAEDNRILVGAVVAYLMRNRRVFLPLYLGFAMVSMAFYGAGSWLPTLLTRGFGMGAKDIGHWLGTATLIAGAAGALTGGIIVDRVSRSGRSAVKMIVLTGICLAALPGAFAVLAPSGHAALMVGAIVVASFPMVGATVIAATQEMVPRNMRGIAISLTGFTNAIVGQTFGPLLIATATVHIFHDGSMVGYSMSMVVGSALLIAAAIFLFGHGALKRSLAAAGDLERIMTLEAGAGASAAGSAKSDSCITNIGSQNA